MRTQRVISVVGCHAEGEVGDVIVGGVLPPAGETMYDKMRTMEREHDDIRQMLMCEPRGSVARHLNLIVPSTRADCAFGVIIMEPTEYVPMSGSNTMCTATVALETGIVAMVEPETRFSIDTPSGPVAILASCKDGKVLSVRIANVPCFVDQLDAVLDVEGYGEVTVDVAFGGMFYAIVDATKLGFDVVASEARELAVLGDAVRVAAREQLEVVHPENPGIRDVTITQLNRPFAGVGQATRNTCIVGPGRSDRSPTGTGTCARMAVLHARGLMKVGDSMQHESLIESRFTGTIIGETTIAGRPAILPTIEGRAWISGFHSYCVDVTDPWPRGYVLPDTWGVSGKITQ
ncbi:MAG TPA: proline racemase family protein [Ilumatobacteraceae bacterium]